MATVKMAELLLDYTLHPRASIDNQNLRGMVAALHAGVKLPPIICDRASRRVVDGFHRFLAGQRLGWDTIAVTWQDYASEAEVYLDAVHRNAGHGQRLTPYDQARCLLRAQELRIAPEQLAVALSITVDRLADLRLRKLAIDPQTRPVAIKATLAGWGGRQLDQRQMMANERSSGMRPLFYVNQAINVLEGGLLDLDDPQVRDRLRRLADLLTVALAEVAIA